jgi:hypothetical protein
MLPELRWLCSIDPEPGAITSTSLFQDNAPWIAPVVVIEKSIDR